MNHQEFDKILKETFSFYSKLREERPEEEKDLIDEEMTGAKKAIEGGNIEAATEYLITMYEVADEHNWLSDKITYPGPCGMDTVVDWFESQCHRHL